MHATRIFMNGASQAVRLPAEYRFEQPDVCVTRIGSMVVIFPADQAWSLFESAVGAVSSDFIRPEQGVVRRDAAALNPAPKPRRTRAYRGASSNAGAHPRDEGKSRAVVSEVRNAKKHEAGSAAKRGGRG